MERVTSWSAGFQHWCEGLHLAEKDPVVLFSLVGVVLAILLALVSIRRSRRNGGSTARSDSQAQELQLRLRDAVAKSEQQQTQLRDGLLRLSERVARLEELLSVGGGVGKGSSATSSSAADESGKKKSDVAPAQLTQGLEKTRSTFLGRLRNIFATAPQVNGETLSELEETLILSDIGVSCTTRLLAAVEQRARESGACDYQAVHEILEHELLSILRDERPTEIVPVKQAGKPLVVLVVGVNGVGKTTTIGKLSWHFAAQGKRVLLAACDTFRAAATEQLNIWAERGGVEIVTGAAGAKPTTVAYEAIHRANEGGFDVVLVDTAGRLHNRANLMNELSGIVRIIDREQPGAPHETILVVDASTGQNALVQAREFHQLAKLTGIIVTKLDGTPKGGIVVGIRSDLQLPVRYIGVGEKIEDLRPFSAEDFVTALLADDEAKSGESEAAPKAARRRG